MVDIIFYEKPGCIGNKRQKKLLEASGHRLEVRDMLSWPWSEQELRPFFGSLPVQKWFNQSAPDIKSGRIDPAALDENEALTLMIKAPLLIRRPLLRVGDECRAGFETEVIDQWIGLENSPAPVGEGCPRGT